MPSRKASRRASEAKRAPSSWVSGGRAVVAWVCHGGGGGLSRQAFWENGLVTVSLQVLSSQGLVGKLEPSLGIRTQVPSL